MPVYGYSCNDCGNSFEDLVSSGQTAACPDCGSERTTQLPVLRTAMRSSSRRDRRVVDMSSGLCPCCSKTRHASG